MSINGHRVAKHSQHISLGIDNEIISTSQANVNGYETSTGGYQSKLIIKLIKNLGIFNFKQKATKLKIKKGARCKTRFDY